MRERRGQVIEAREVAPRVTLVVIEPEAPVLAKAGQFLSLRLADGGRRSYSIVSSPGTTSRIELLLKSAAPAGGTAAISASLAPGAPVSFFGPMGYFLYEHGHRGTVIFGATGIGITAILPMIEEALADAAARVHLLWGLRAPADRVLSDRLDALEANARFAGQMFYSGRGEGYITPHLISLATSATAPRLYLCGQGAMVADVRRALPAETPIHTEVFY